MSVNLVVVFKLKTLSHIENMKILYLPTVNLDFSYRLMCPELLDLGSGVAAYALRVPAAGQ